MSSAHGKDRAIKVPVPKSGGAWGCFPCLSMRTRGSNRSPPFHGARGREVQRPAGVRIRNGKRRAPRPQPSRYGSGYGSRPCPKRLAPTIPGYSTVSNRQAWSPKAITMFGPAVPRLNKYGAGHGLWPCDMAGSYPAWRPLPPPPFSCFFFLFLFLNLIHSVVSLHLA